MGDAGRNADDIACGEFMAGASLDGRATLFIGSGGFGFGHGAANDERGGAALDNEDVRFGAMPFSLAICFSVGQEEIFVRVIGKFLRGRVVRIGGGFCGERFGDFGERGGSPVLEAVDGGAFRGGDGKG